MLFSQLTREQAIKLKKLDNRTDDNYRAQQVELLYMWANIYGYSYYEKATVQILKDLAPYGFVVNSSVYHEYPECVMHAYTAMFNALDDFITEVIGDHYELQGWDDPMGKVIWCEDHFGREEAIQAYNEAVGEIGGYIMLRKVDKEGMPIDDDITACNF